MVTSADVAKLAGVSQSTVSYVMSGTRSISEETRARVEAAMRELNYHPNAGARALAGRRTNVVGLIARLPGNTDVAALLPFIETITTYCRERDYDVVLVPEDEGPAGLERLARRSIVDAIIMMDIRRDDDRVETARKLGLPVVLIGIPDDSAGLDCVDFDVDRAGRMAVDELVSSRHGRILLIGEPPSVTASNFGFIQRFFDGATDAAVRAGVPLDVFVPSLDSWAGYEEFPDLLTGGDGPLGVIARTPQAIDISMQLMVSRGLIPGRDVSLVGICTDATATSFRFPVTNVSPEPRDVSRAAMKRMFDRLGGDASDPVVTLIAPKLSRRATTVQRAS